MENGEKKSAQRYERINFVKKRTNLQRKERRNERRISIMINNINHKTCNKEVGYNEEENVHTEKN